jgi:hypothetical protein
MRKLFRLSIVSVLAISLVLFGPLSAMASPIISADPAVTFVGTDLTAGLETARGISVGQVTAIGTIHDEDGGDNALIAGLDSIGNAFLVSYDFRTGDFTDWTEGLVIKYSNVARITAIGSMNGEFTWVIGGVNTEGKAFLVDACNFCMFNHSHDYANADVLEHSAVSGIDTYFMSDGADIGKAGVTMSGPAGFFLCDTESHTTTEVTQTVMPTATGPVKWAGLSGISGIQGFTVQRGLDFWLTGGSGGNVLAYGDTVTGQTYANLPGIVDTLAIDDGPDGWMLAGRGTDGYMKLFSDADYPIESASLPAGPVALNLPQTMTDTVDAAAAYPYYIIGGTGGGRGHLYKYKNFAKEFIDFDYLLSGMSGLNSMAVSGFIINTGNVAGQDAGALISSLAKVIVGGSGAVKLVLLTETPTISGPPTPKDAPSSKECGDGSANVTVPAGAIGVDYYMQVEKVATGTPAAPSGFSLLGHSYEFDCYDSAGVPITDFSQPVTITIHYDEADLGSLSEDSLQIYWYNSTSSAWEAVTPCVIDKVNNTITIQTMHFSQFGILGMTTLPYTGF